MTFQLQNSRPLCDKRNSPKVSMKGHIMVALLISVFLTLTFIIITYVLDTKVNILNITVWYDNKSVSSLECEKSLNGTRLLYLPANTYFSITYIPSFIIPLYFFSRDTIRSKKNKSIMSQYPMSSLSISIGNALLIMGNWIYNACSCEKGLMFKNSCTYYVLLTYIISTFTLRHHRSLFKRIGPKCLKLKLVLLHLFFINMTSWVSFSLFSMIPTLRANILIVTLTSILLVTNIVYTLIDYKDNQERGIYRLFWIALVVVLGGSFFLIMDSELCIKNMGSGCLSYLFFSTGSCLLYLYQRSIRDVSREVTRKNNIILNLSGRSESDSDIISDIVLDDLGEAMRDYDDIVPK